MLILGFLIAVGEYATKVVEVGEDGEDVGGEVGGEEGEIETERRGVVRGLVNGLVLGLLNVLVVAVVENDDVIAVDMHKLLRGLIVDVDVEGDE